MQNVITTNEGGKYIITDENIMKGDLIFTPQFINNNINFSNIFNDQIKISKHDYDSNCYVYKAYVILGPFQKKWIQSLKDNSTRQTNSCLARKEGDTYKACCLGEGLIIYNNHFNIPNNFKNDYLYDGHSKFYLVESYKLLGLRDIRGSLKSYNRTSLASMNDSGDSWKYIANFMEEKPNEIFIKSI